MMKQELTIGLALSMILSCAGPCAAAAAAESSFYKGPGLFSTRPSETASVSSIDRFGPVGMGIELHQPAFVMKIKNIEAGSRAAAAGKLKAGQTIETINGQKLADIDPRFQLAKIITDVEAADGVIKFMIKDKADSKAEEVIVKIPVLGAYSKTWPLNCPKSDKIVRAYGDFLAKKPTGGNGLEGFQLLFLLSTGEDKDLETARKWVKAIVAACKGGGGVSGYAWHIGIAGTPLAEYYLRTGDKSVLPVLKAYADNARWGQTRGGWAGRGGQAAVTYGGGGGHLNAGGTAVVTFLMLAKECGVDVDERTLQSALTHFYRFAGRGNVPYGDNRPETGFVDNGKNGNLALGMAAAASLTPDGENSIYARARDVCATTGFYYTSFMLHGHTGGGIGEVWRSAAMGLLYSKAPEKYRQFMDNRQWIYELSRRYTGSFGILGGARYDDETWGAGFALTYTMPRKKLRICGAPKTPYVQEYKLPVRPWGVEADDVFESLDAAADKDGNKQDLSKEILANDACRPVLGRLTVPGDVGDDLLRKYVHHQDSEIRKIAARKVMGANSGYIGWKTRGGSVKIDLMIELLKDKDPRVRQAAIDGLIYGLTVDKNDKSAEFTIDADKYFTKEICDLLIGTIKDPAESWWVKDNALRALQFASADMLVPHVDLILPYLQDKDWWLQNAALTALAPVVADERCYKKVLPAVGEMLRTCEAYNGTSSVGGICAKLKEASPAVQKLAATTIGHSFETFAGAKVTPAGQDISRGYESQLGVIANSLTAIPGGYETLYDVARKRFPNETLPYKKQFLSADPNQLGPELQKAVIPIIRDQLIYEFIGQNRRILLGEVDRTKQSTYGSGHIDLLVDLYQRIGVHDYDWHNFGPDLRNEQWDYFMFVPKEKQAYDISPWRYRNVTYPAGMEKWQAVDFNPKTAGWKTGMPPFGQFAGKLVIDAKPCSNSDCYCKTPMRTLWDKEVLLVHKTFKVPPLQPGHLYRIRTGQGQHVGSGDGYRIYINGKLLVETKDGNGKRTGGKPRGGFITREFAPEFSKGEITVAATTFLRYGNKGIVQMPPVPQGIFSIWIEEMKVPPINDEAVRKSATSIAMLSSEWQDKQNPDSTVVEGDDDKFSYDGKFVANPKLLGAWTAVEQVKTIDEFNPGKTESTRTAGKTGKAGKSGKAAKNTKAARGQIAEIAFKDNGLTSDGLIIWSGNTMMDLNRYEALKMTVKTIDGTDYLFIEAGGFSAKNPAGWKSPLNVMKKQAK